MIEEQILSAVLDTGNVYEMNRFNINANDFQTQKDVYKYIVEYHNDHGGTPDYRTVASEFDGFEYQANVSEPFKGMAARLKQQTARRRAYEMLQLEAGKSSTH